MRTCDRTLGIVLIGVAIGLAPALAFDGTTNRAQLQSLPSPATPLHPGETARATVNITSLEYAAERGDSTAQWRLGHMYMKGKACRAATCARPATSARSPTATPRTAATRPTPASWRARSSRSGATTSTAFRIPTSR